MATDADLAEMVRQDIKETKTAAAAAVESWVTSPSGLGVLFTERAYSLYGLAKRSRDQSPYVRSGRLRSHVMAAGRVKAAGDDPFRVVWWADSRLLNFMKGKKAIYREQFERVSKSEMDAVDAAVQRKLDKVN